MTSSALLPTALDGGGCEGVVDCPSPSSGETNTRNRRVIPRLLASGSKPKDNFWELLLPDATKCYVFEGNERCVLNMSHSLYAIVPSYI